MLTVRIPLQNLMPPFERTVDPDQLASSLSGSLYHPYQLYHS